MHQIFAFELLDGGVGEGHVAAVVDVGVEFVKLFMAVVFDDVAVVFARFGKFFDVVEEMRRLEFAVGDFAQMKNGQTRGQILIVGRVLRNQVGGGLDDGFVDVVGADAVVKLNVRFELDLGDGHVFQPLCRPSNHAVDFV